MHPWLQPFAQWGTTPTTTDEQRRHIAIINLANVAGAVQVAGTGLFYLAIHLSLPGELMLGLASFYVLNLLAFGLHRNLLAYLYVESLGQLLLPNAVQLSLGGFAGSGAIVVWGIMVPLGAAMFLSTRETLLGVSLFVALMVVDAVLEWQLDLRPVPPPEVRRVLFAINVGGLAMYVAACLVYFIRGREATLAQLEKAHARSEELLLNVLPRSIAERLKERPGTIADYFESATILFADIVGFTTLSAHVTPGELVAMLDGLFREFDRLADKHHLEKIKTIGDAYMVVGGLPVPDAGHAHAVAAMALDMLEVLARQPPVNGQRLGVRIGINTGPVVAGVIGERKFIYDLWGDAVNTASRMESHGLANSIQVAEATRTRLEDAFVFEARGTIPVKGKGELPTWLLKGRKPVASAAG